MEVKLNNILFENKIIGVIGTINNVINSIDKKTKFEVVKNYDNTYGLSVEEYLKTIMFSNYCNTNNYQKKIQDSIKIVGLTKNYLLKKIASLSQTEYRLVMLGASLLSNPDLLVFDDFFNCFDTKNIKNILKLLNKLVERYNKSIVIISNDVEFIYTFTKEVIVYKNKKVILSGTVENVFEENRNLLLKNGIAVPKSVIFTDKVKKLKKVKLNYHKDIRDLIKDIYKKV